MQAFVVDASFAASWCFPDERTERTQRLLNSLGAAEFRAVVPTLWPYEVSNAVLAAVRRKRLPIGEAATFVRSLAALPVVVMDAAPTETIFRVGQQYGLTAYDGAYPELAMRTKLPLATLHSQLVDAAAATGIDLY